MPALSESNNLGDLLKYEAPQFYSRQTVTVTDGQTLSLGSVVGVVSATGNIQALDPAAVDGTEVAAGVMIQDAAPSGADGEGLLIARHAIVADHALVWPVGITENEKASATGQLIKAGILVRQGV
ncbi:head decoration protein [Magnetofaba australis]|nr:head decoration protein [Magnetofaba australis]